jgi:hypothetical protein
MICAVFDANISCVVGIEMNLLYGRFSTKMEENFSFLNNYTIKLLMKEEITSLRLMNLKPERQNFPIHTACIIGENRDLFFQTKLMGITHKLKFLGRICTRAGSPPSYLSY